MSKPENKIYPLTACESISDPVVGKYCVIRCDRAGVFAGTVESVEGQTVLARNVRRLWYWDGAASLSQLAVDGVKKPANCKFTVSVDTILLTDAIEIIPATEAARDIIQKVQEWKI